MTTSYNAKEVMVNFGPLPLLGAADGDFCTVAYQGDGVGMVVGARGATVCIDNHDNSAEVTMRLFATGDGQNTLSALLAHYTAGNPFLPLAVISVSTGESVVAGSAKIKKLPDKSFGTGAPIREIVFVVPEPFDVTGPEV